MIRALRVWAWTLVYDYLDARAGRKFIDWQLAKMNHGNVMSSQQAYVRAHRIAHKAYLRIVAARLSR